MIDTNSFCRVQFSAFQFKCDVRINDVPIVALPGEKNLSTAFTINEWVREGENILSIDLTGNPTELPAAAVMRISIGLCRDLSGADFASVLTVELNREDAAAGVVLRPFHLPELAFGTYDEHLLEPIRLDDREESLRFRRTYEAYYHAVASKDMAAVLQYHEYRTAAYALRYYEPVALRITALRETFADSFANEFLLKRIPELDKPNLHMGGRLVTMDYADDGLPLTTFTGKGATYTRTYQAYWGKTAQGDFFIYR